MKYDGLCYKATVQFDTGRLTQFVFVYNLDEGREIVGMEFYSQVWSNGAAPTTGKTSFAEQLAHFLYAVHTYRGPRADDQAVIEAKLAEVYGAGLKATVCIL